MEACNSVISQLLGSALLIPCLLLVPTQAGDKDVIPWLVLVTTGWGQGCHSLAGASDHWLVKGMPSLDWC